MASWIGLFPGLVLCSAACSPGLATPAFGVGSVGLCCGSGGLLLVVLCDGLELRILKLWVATLALPTPLSAGLEILALLAGLGFPSWIGG